MIKNFLGWFDTEEPIRVVKETAHTISEEAACVKRGYEQYQRQIESYKKQIELVELQRQKETKLFLSIIDHIDDLIWAKDMEGRYIIANKAFREKFCYGMKWSELRNKTDLEIVSGFKSSVGDENHTLGADTQSDLLVKNTEQAKRFLEQGTVNGKLVKLVVNKSPVYDFEGVMFATCGTGKDVTKWHEDLERVLQASNSCLGDDGKELLLRELNKLEFGTKDY